MSNYILANLFFVLHITALFEEGSMNDKANGRS